MPIQRSRHHGARKAAKIIAKNFARLNHRQNRQQEQLNDVCIEMEEQREQQQQRIKRVERNLDNVTDTLSDEVDRLSSRTVGLSVALVVFGALLVAALIVIWSKLNG